MLKQLAQRPKLQLARRALTGTRSPEDVVRDFVPAVGGLIDKRALWPAPAADGPILILSPHLDDATLSCWSVLAGEQRVEVCNVYTRPPAPGFVTLGDRLAGGTESAAMMRSRLDEESRALGHVGLTPRNLDFLDAQYRRAAPGERRAGPSLAQLATAVTKAVPKASRILAPAGIGGHVDHELVRDLGFALYRRGFPLELYADLPYAVTFGWPAWVVRETASPYVDVDAYWERFLPRPNHGFQRLHGRAIVLDDEQASTKIAALREYTTQFPTLNGGPVRLLEQEAIVRREVRWYVE